MSHPSSEIVDTSVALELESPGTSGGEIDLGASAIDKVTWRLIPLLVLLYIVNYIDRTNVSMAKLQMLDLKILNDATYGAGAGLFFIGYCLFEVPSNLILQKVGARRWIARIMISWGLISSAMMFTRGPHSFYALRILLGVAEAGFFPGIVLYLTDWVPSRQRAGILAMFLTSIALSGIVGTPLSGMLMKLDGHGGLRGWQWMFLLEGVPSIFLGIGILTFWRLPNRPSEVDWLTPTERSWIEKELERDGSQTRVRHVAQLRAAAVDGRLWILSLLYYLLITGLYGFIFWVPSLVSAIFKASTQQVGWISAIPYVVAALAMVLIAIQADRRSARRWPVAISAMAGAIGTALVTLCSSHPWLGMLALCLSAIGIFGVLGPFWAIPTCYLRGRAAAGGIAIINSAGALAGYTVSYGMGYLKQASGTFTKGLLCVAISLALGAVVVLCVPRAMDAT